MAKVCAICGKGKTRGNTVQRRGLAKKKGGVGKKTTSITKRVFKPNLQRVKIIIAGKVQKVWVCAKCLKHGKIQKA